MRRRLVPVQLRAVRVGAGPAGLSCAFGGTAVAAPEPVRGRRLSTLLMAVCAIAVAWAVGGVGVAQAASGIKSVSAGAVHTCAVKTDGSIACWGDNSSNEAVAPAGAFKSVSAGDSYTCAVKADDSLACWGSNAYGRTDAPAGTFTSVSAGAYHACAVKADDDSLACWGSNDNGETVAPAGAFKSVSAGLFHTCAVKADDSLACWGNNDLGQTDVPVDTTAPVVTPTITGTLGDGGWYTSDVDLTWAVSDPESPVSAQDGCDPVAVHSDQASTSYTCTATSAGGTASPSVSIKRDAHAPTVGVTGVSDGAIYTLGSVPAAGCDTQDAPSGVAHAATLSSVGGPLGMVTATCAGAKDNAGNSAGPVSATYAVHYAFGGFFAPIANGGVLNTLKAGSAVPVRFTLAGDQGLSILAGGRAPSQQITCDPGAPTAKVATVKAGFSLSYDATSDRYTYVWTTEKGWAGTCRQLTLTLIDGTSHTAKFKLTK
jgi:Regulator of chromosome condensation (RCC1) repeat